MKLKLTREQKIADRFLRSFDMVGERLESSIAGLEAAESAQKSITSSIGAMGFGGTNHDKMCDSLARIDKAIGDINEYAGRFSDSFMEIETFISEVQRIDVQAGRVLRLTYIQKLTVKEITQRDETAYSKKSVYEQLKRGLDIAFDLLAKEDE